MKKTIILLMSIVMLLTACSPSGGRSDASVTDMLGREVALPAKAERVACIGAGALRLYSYVGDLDKLCGVEACEYGFLISVRPYQTVNAERFAKLPSVGAGGPQGSPDAEALLAAKPDVIFSLYTSDSSAMDELQAATGVPVIVLSYGKTEAFDADIIASLRLMGKVLGREERANEVADYIEALRDDLGTRTKDIPEKEKKTVYLGCQSNYGTHGIGSSTANYSLFDAVNAKNVLDLAGYSGYQGSLDLETIVRLDPEVMLLDAGGLGVLAGEYAKNKKVFDSLTAFRTGEVYLQMPYNAYYTNLEIAYADAYFAGKTLFPDRFADVDIESKFTEISKFLLGEDFLSELKAAIPLGWKKLDTAALK